MYSRLPADIEYDPNGFHHAWRGFPSVPKVYLWQVPLLESNHHSYVRGVWGGNSRCILYKTVFRAKGWQEMAHHDGRNRAGWCWMMSLHVLMLSLMWMKNRMVVNDTWWMLKEWNANAEGWMMDDGWWMMDERLMTDMYDWYADWWIWLTHMIKDQ